MNGLPFKLQFSDRTGTKHDLTCEVKEAVIMKTVLKASPIPQTPSSSSWWYSFLSKFDIANINFRHSRINTQFTLKASAGGVSLFGMLHLDEANDLKYTVKGIGRTVADLLEYYKKKLI